VTRTRYDTIGTSYTRTRRADPRVAAQIHAALGDAKRIVNIGAGSGSYEPEDREVTAVEPSPTMIAQRPADAAAVVQAFAESLPFRDSTFDAALAIFTVHHWRDTKRGLSEIARVARRQVILSYDAVVEERFWLVDEYFPEIAALDAQSTGYTSEAIAAVIDVRRVETVMVPADCIDGFAACFWNRPEAYTDPVVQAGISGLARLDAGVRTRATERLRADLASGAWDARHGYLRTLRERDFGYRLIIAGA
jgi:ubiquinone/menaquinone biosynthesis C-methylase UbiE